MNRKVKYIGCTEPQKKWGNHTGDFNKLVKYNIYTIIKTEIHSWHTTVFLLEAKGSFNSVCFYEVKDND